MITIDKRHPAITNSKSGRDNCYISFQQKGRIHFTKEAAQRFKLKRGLCIHFTHDETKNRWWFYCDADKSGFVLHGAEDMRKGLMITNKSMALYFFKCTGLKEGARFYLVQDGKHVSIDISKTFEKFIKK